MNIVLLCLGSSSEARTAARMEQLVKKFNELKKDGNKITFILTGLPNETQFMQRYLELAKVEVNVEVVDSKDTYTNLSNTIYFWKYCNIVYFSTGKSHAKRVQQCVEELSNNVLFKHIPSNEKEVWYEKLANYLYCFPFGRKVLGWIAAQFRN